LDAGALLFKGPTLSVKRGEQEKIKAAGIVKSYNVMGYDAVGVARNDLLAGLPFIKKLAKESKFTWLSSNLVDKKSKKPIFQRYRIFKKGALKVGVFALTSPFLPSGVEGLKEVEVIDWHKAAASVIAEIAPKCDLIVLLSNLVIPDNRKISAEFPEIRLIIQSGVAAGFIHPKAYNQTLIFQSGKQGKQIGVMEIEWHGGTWGAKISDQLRNQKNNLDRILWRLSKYQRYKDPETDLKGNPQKLQAYRRLLQQKAATETKIATLSKELAANPIEPPVSTFKNRFVPMATDLPDDMEVVKIVDGINQEINRVGRRLIAQKGRIVTNFVGSKSCKRCHENEYAVWKKSRHARAYTTLLNKGQQFNLDCLPCHITGSADLDQADAHNLTPDFQGVGCENCHGAGREHLKNPKGSHLKARPQEKLCLGCHSEEHDGSFNYGKYVPIIKH